MSGAGVNRGHLQCCLMRWIKVLLPRSDSCSAVSWHSCHAGVRWRQLPPGEVVGGVQGVGAAVVDGVDGPRKGGGLGPLRNGRDRSQRMVEHLSPAGTPPLTWGTASTLVGATARPGLGLMADQRAHPAVALLLAAVLLLLLHPAAALLDSPSSSCVICAVWIVAPSHPFLNPRPCCLGRPPLCPAGHCVTTLPRQPCQVTSC